MLIGKYKTYSYSIITQTIFPRNSTQGIVRSHEIARVSAPVKIASVNIQISNYGHQLPEHIQLIFYLNAGPRATPHWVGSVYRTPSHSSLGLLRYRTPRHRVSGSTGLRDTESRGPVRDAETLGSRSPVPDPETLPYGKPTPTKLGSRIRKAS